jgi:hypothetical protein
VEAVKRVARRGDWQSLPLPDECREVPLERLYTAAEFTRIAAGRVPEVMEDKWFVFYEEPWLYLHRSWSGFCVFKVRFEPAVGGSRIAGAWANPGWFHRETDEQLPPDDMRHVLFDSLLLGALLGNQVGQRAEAEWDNYFEALRVVAKDGPAEPHAAADGGA